MVLEKEPWHLPGWHKAFVSEFHRRLQGSSLAAQETTREYISFSFTNVVFLDSFVLDQEGLWNFATENTHKRFWEA